jgi:hypothetical protein
LSASEERAHLSLWALLKAPLHIGCDVRTADDATIAALTHPEMLAINQDALGVPGRRVWSSLGPWAAAGPFARLFNWAGGVWSGREDLYVGSLSLRAAAALCEAAGPECAGFAYDAGAPPASENGTAAAPVRLFRALVPAGNSSMTGNATAASSTARLLRGGVFRKSLLPDLPAGTREVWAGPLAGGDVAVVLFNRGTLPALITARWADVGLPRDANAKVRLIWERLDLGSFRGEFSALVPGHGVVMLRLTPLQPPAPVAPPPGLLARLRAWLQAKRGARL